MEASQQVVVCRVAKGSVKSKTCEQRLAEEPCCPVCLEELTDETLCKPVKCHNICINCRPMCNKCPLCRKRWPSDQKVKRRRCEGWCESMTVRKCSGFQFNTIIRCEKYVCRKCSSCETCKDVSKEHYERFMMRFTNNPLYRPRV
jgi:hypothetical protein